MVHIFMKYKLKPIIFTKYNVQDLDIEHYYMFDYEEHEVLFQMWTFFFAKQYIKQC